ncbi:peptide deformylase [Stomatobaculum sp. F0698]|uniref:peptide deformylase n=1 Tax=Stomatobaculum sp. F0698 TaxID=3059030 RepID=UPI00272B0058|nr:peptide deformylase [Stomatobaculum sp. F0698]WLD85938.1 peptide deformylase [Stomatobaculum sp. F0698]
MALRNIREIGDPILNQRAKEVREMTPNLRALIEDMVETMRHANGVGLAAPQVGVLKRLVVIECEEGELHVLINPEIIARDGEQTGYEGCLSVPGKTGIVTRPNHVKVKALNENMEPVTVEGEELLARALCHELDHLDGHLYTEMAEELYTNEELEAMQAEEDEDEA